MSYKGNVLRGMWRNALVWGLAPLCGATALSLLIPSLALGAIVLATSTAPRFGGGSVRCSGVNVGQEPVEMNVELIDVSTGVIEISTLCADGDDEADEDAVPPGQRCTVVSSSTAILFCKITVDIAGGSGETPNPALALLRQHVRANVTASGSNGMFVVQEAQ